MRFILTISFLVMFGFVFGQVSEAKVSIDRHSFLIGEQTTVHYEVSSRDAYQAEGIHFEKGIPLSNLDANREDSISLEVISTLRDTFYHDVDVSRTYVAYLVTAWDTGHFMIPPQIFTVNGEEIFSMPIEFSVGTVRVDTTKDIKPIKDILEANSDDKKDSETEVEEKTVAWLWIVAGVIVLLLLLFLIWFIFIRSKSNNIEPAVVLKPHESALLKLQELHQELNKGIDNKVYYSELTTVLRVYIEKRYYVPALEKTSKQILKTLRGKEITPSVYKDLKDLLNLADFVKFAKANPDSHENEMNYLKAVSFVNHTTLKDLTNGL